MSLKNNIFIVFILSCLFLSPYSADAQLLKKGENKKVLKLQIDSLTKELDSLKKIIDGGAIEMADTVQLEDTPNSGEYTFINSHIFEDAQPGCNPDSLLHILYNERNIPMERYIIESDSIELVSNIPDSIYIAKI